MLVALSGGDRPSLITLRLSSTNPEVVTQRILEVVPQIEEELQQGSVVKIGNETVRIRRLPIRSKSSFISYQLSLVREISR